MNADNPFTSGDENPAGTHIDRVPQLRRDLRAIAQSAEKIVGQGQAAFEDADGDLLRLAAKAVLIDLSILADRLPAEFRQTHPSVPWRQVRGLRNFLAHDDDGSDYALVWGVLAVDLPRIAKKLIDDTNAAG